MVRLYNTLSRKLEDFIPRQKNQVGLYSCGPTVYAPPHLGNMRYFIFVDTLRRVLHFNQLPTKHVMNVTDVGHLTSDEDTGDDKMEIAAKLGNKTAAQIAEEITRLFLNDLQALNVAIPPIMPRATQTIDWQIDLIKQLVVKGVTYQTSDGVYFDTTRFPTYGQLSGQALDSKRAGARVAVGEKHHPSDFALWKISQPQDKRQMEWPSPWGTGFPGWHIECSAMAMHELGEQIDLHTGGIDHIAVHHENEIAQSEAATGKHPFVKYWLHGEFLVLPGKRMGKSEGNAVTLADVINKQIHPLAYRYLCLQAHYRSKLDFTWESLKAANIGLHRLWSWIAATTDSPAVGCAEFEARFTEAVNNDLNTPQAIALLNEMLRGDYPDSAKLQSLSVFDRVLGLGFNQEFARSQMVPMDDLLRELLKQREDARQKKDYTGADVIREKIAGMGIVIDDTPEGPQLRKKL